MVEDAFEGDGFTLPLLRSPLLAAMGGGAGGGHRFVHGFTTRRGGVSGPPFHALNLGMKWGDSRENVLENRRRVRAAAGGGPAYAVTQVHGAAVVAVRPGDESEAVARLEADGLCAAAPGLTLLVYVADCVPVLMADARTGAFAAVHAGWRGTVAGVVTAAIARLRAEHGARPEDVRVALGPAIGPCCFEVGPEVVAAFEGAIPGARAGGVVVEGGARPHIDLKRANRMLLEAAGVPAAHIDDGPACTSCDAARFYSYRRDHGNTGQMAAFIARAP